LKVSNEVRGALIFLSTTTELLERAQFELWVAIYLRTTINILHCSTLISFVFSTLLILVVEFFWILNLSTIYLGCH